MKQKAECNQLVYESLYGITTGRSTAAVMRQPDRRAGRSADR